MNDKPKWNEPDWQWPPRVDFADNALAKTSVVSVILLGGIILGLVVAAWYLIGLGVS